MFFALLIGLIAAVVAQNYRIQALEVQMQNSQVQEQLTDLKIQEAKLSLFLVSSHPELVAARKQIASLERE